MKIDFLSDPGHGWAKVPKALLVKLGIAGKISSYSYQRGEFAYLEEDCDLPLFEMAAKKAGIELSWRDRIADKSSRVRGYDSYHQ